MQYEEYRDRMVAQGRTPLPREHYASQVEAGYMLANLTQDEFCHLPDRAIVELSRAANRCDVHDRRADAAVQECDRLRAQVAVHVEAVAECERLRGRVAEYQRFADAAGEECARLRARVAVLETIEEERDAARVEAEKLAAAHATLADHVGNAWAIGILARMISTRQDLTLDEISALKIGMRRAEKRVVDLARNKVHRRERLAAREAAEPAPQPAPLRKREEA